MAEYAVLRALLVNTRELYPLHFRNFQLKNSHFSFHEKKERRLPLLLVSYSAKSHSVSRKLFSQAPYSDSNTYCLQSLAVYKGNIFPVISLSFSTKESIFPY